MKQRVLLLILAVAAAVLVAGVGSAGAYNEGACDIRNQVRDYSPLHVQGYADVTCNEQVPAISIVNCLFRSTLGPIINWNVVSCVSIKVLNARFRSTIAGHVCVGGSRHLYRDEAIVQISWPSGLGSANVTWSGTYAANCG